MLIETPELEKDEYGYSQLSSPMYMTVAIIPETTQDDLAYPPINCRLVRLEELILDVLAIRTGFKNVIDI